MYIKRSLPVPNKSFMLLGPRGTGKSTWVKHNLKSAFEINLLKSSQYLPLSQNPTLLHEWVGHLKKGQWVFIDEVQKIPALLDEVHFLYEEKKLNFALSGSSARKLKRSGANLLAGRALQSYIYPLIYSEYHSTSELDSVLHWGSLPGVLTDLKNKQDTLMTYVETYLKQELMEEGLIRKLEPFARFLRVAGLYNAQILNIENIARESHVGRTTVDKYFEILEDTLLGSRLQSIQLGLFSKEVQHPKFYFFDIGVSRACAGLIFEDIDSVYLGYSFEAYIYHELRAYNSYHKKHRDIFYYSVSGGGEIDFLIETNKKTLSRARSFFGIEVKSSKTWDRRWTKSLVAIREASQGKIHGLIGIYRGNQIITQEGITIFPVHKFLEKLTAGDFF